MTRTVEIVGGGLAGLSLGHALQRNGVPVTIHEAGSYPRHRVCGEFISGLDRNTRELLVLDPMLEDAHSHREVVWYLRDRAIQRQRLPSPALAISRHRLDQRLADRFVAAGGTLHTRSRIDLASAPAGRVFASGRIRARGDWLGLKLHARQLPLASELEVHLGDRAYVGLCEVEDGRVNVSGLFRQRPGVELSRRNALPAYLEAAGLPTLARRLASAVIIPESCSAVAGLRFGRPSTRPGRIELGDAFAMIPPFTGNGMAMALQSAALALPLLRRWAEGYAAWEETVRAVNRRLTHHFRLRLASARILHPFLLEPNRQRWLSSATQSGLLPLRSLYHALH